MGGGSGFYLVIVLGGTFDKDSMKGHSTLLCTVDDSQP